MRSVDFTNFTALDVSLNLGIPLVGGLVRRAMSRHENGRMFSIWNGTNGSVVFQDHTMYDAVNMGILMMGCPGILVCSGHDLRGE